MRKKLSKWKGILAFVVILIGLYLASGKEIFAVGILLVFVMAGISLGFFLLSSSSVKVKIIGTHQGNREEEASFFIEIENNGKGPLMRGKISICVENSMTEEQLIESFIVGLWPREKRQINITLLPKHSGCITISVDEINSCDFLNVFEKKIPCYETSKYFVLPVANPIDLSQDDISKYDMESFRYSEARKGDDSSETFSIREYEKGDKIKAVHWKLSAKSGKVMVKEASYPIDNNILIILDKCMKDDGQSKDDILDLFVSLSRRLLEQGIVHSVGWYDSKEKKFLARDIRNNMNLIEATRECLVAPFDSKVSTVHRFLEQEIDRKWSSYIYVSKDERDIERLMIYGDVSIYRPENFR